MLSPEDKGVDKTLGVLSTEDKDVNEIVSGCAVY